MTAMMDNLQVIIDTVTDAIVIIGADYRIRMMNAAGRRLYLPEGGFGDFTYCHQLLHHLDSPCPEKAFPCSLREIRRTGKPCSCLHMHHKADGSIHPVEIHAAGIFDSEGRLDAVVEVCRDVTDRLAEERENHRRKERMFIRSKEESIMTLAGGVAHQFNNLLVAVIGNAELLRLTPDLSGKEKEFIDSIMRAGVKMAEITNQILAYAKGGKYIPETLDMMDIARDVAATLADDRPAGVEVFFTPPGDADDGSARGDPESPWPVKADRSQMIQMLGAIIRNAFEAMSRTGGRLHIWAGNLRAPEGWECEHGRFHPAGPYLHLRISDTGPGIAESDRPRIFEPFFTTRFPGRGLGLAAALGISQNHDGCIFTENGPQEGAVFHVLLPAHGVEPGPEKRPGRAARTKGEKILAVDDEEQILNFLRAILTQHNFEVLEAKSGREAVDLLAVEGKNLGLVILDVHLADASGRELYQRIKKARPSLPVMLSSGYDRDSALAGLELEPGDCFLQKPYGGRMLMDEIRKRIRNPAGPDPDAA